MAKKGVDWTVTLAGLLGLGVAGVQLGYIPAVSGTYDVAASLALTSGIMGLILLATRANIV